MGVVEVALAIQQLDLEAVGRALLAHQAAPVCEASLDDWKRYVAGEPASPERAALPCHALEWRDGRVFVTELPGALHEALVSAVEAAVFAATGCGRRFLVAPTSSYVLDEAHVPLQADAGFGPTSSVLGAGPPLPLKWDEYRTLKLEVGVGRDWPQLDRRAEQWRRIPGVHFVLCLRVSSDLKTRQFRLDEVVDGQLRAPRMPVTDIGSGAAVLHIDSRRLLGLAPHALVPAEFAQPTLAVDLSAAVESAIKAAADEQ